LDIKKVDGKPMVIHTKEKPRLHVKGAPETKIKGRNVLTVRHGLENAGTASEKNVAGDRKIKLKTSSVHDTDKRKKAVGGMEYSGNAIQDRGGEGTVQGRQETRQPINRETRMYAQYHRLKAKKGAAKNKPPVPVVSIAAKTALEEMDGGNEVYDAYMAAGTLAKPATNAVDAGRNLYRSKAAKEKQRKIKKKQAGSRIKGKAVKESAVKAARKTAQKAVKETGKKAAKETSNAAVKTAASAASTVAGGVFTGILAGEAAGLAMDKRNVKNSTRNRMIKLFVENLRQKENPDGIGKALKDIVLMRFSMMAKYIIRYVGGFLLALFAVVALIALPVIAVVAVIYNSPFAVFFPSISSGETIQEVLSAYVSEFNDAVNEELADHAGYGASEKIYVDFEGSGTPDNFCDILMVYMVKHGDGDTATDMTDKAKQNLKAIFDDMCSYTVSSRMDTVTDEGGNATTTTVKEVNVELKSCYDMVSIYGFNEKEQEMLAQLMNPEYLAMVGSAGGGGGGDPGEVISPEQYQAVVDAISDENGKKVVAFALSKVGYPYSQAYRDSGDYYDCSSLAYYAWQSAGVSIMHEGSNTAASEGKFCYDNNLLVNYDEMQPGDLIFYSSGKNGRFMNITHVAIYAGDGKVVEAANARLGVVYRQERGHSIVFIGRPR
jgi:cell wall-associated NlpC family hydrolase